MATTTVETAQARVGKHRIGKAAGACAVVSAGLMVGSLAFAGSASATPTPLADKYASTITTIPLGKKDLKAAKASITAEKVHVKVDACMGPVTIRSYAQFAVSTAVSDNSVFVYSDPTWL